MKLFAKTSLVMSLGTSEVTDIFSKERSSKLAIYFHSVHSTYLGIK